MADNLEDIATQLRRYADECGGEHHTPKEIEKYLKEVANEISEMTYQTTKLIEVSRSLLGVSNSALALWERQNHIEWLNGKGAIRNDTTNKGRTESLS